MAGIERTPGILLVSQMFPPAVGGSGVLLENVYSRLPDVGVSVVTDERMCRGTDTRRGRMTISRTSIHGTNWGVLGARALWRHLRLARTIAAHARGRNVVVHCGRAQPEGVAAMLAQRLFGSPPFVFWAHGEDVACALTSRDFAMTMRQVHRRAAAILANSHHTARVLASAGVPAEKVCVIHPGVDPVRFNPDIDTSALRRKLAPNGELLLLSVGRMQRRKGHDLMLEAIARLPQTLPRCRYVIVGDGEERQRLETLAAALGVVDRVLFEGEVSWDVLPEYFAACDLFVLPNRVDAHDFEGFGIVFLEAAAAGKAVIGGRSGGVPEAVSEGETGLLVAGTDAGELAAAVQRLLSSDGLRRDMGAAGRARVLRSFTWECAALRLADFQARLTSGVWRETAEASETVGAHT
jgi:phosphatidylinositol alpha-1,6-mannosyltransferase